MTHDQLTIARRLARASTALAVVGTLYAAAGTWLGPWATLAGLIAVVAAVAALGTIAHDLANAVENEQLVGRRGGPR